MSVTVSLSTRVAPELRERLKAAAAARGVALSAFARDLLSAGLDGGALAAREDGALVNEVECRFSRFPPDAGLRHQVCMSLAREVERGGTAGIAAGKELLIEIAHAEQLYEPDDFEDEDEGDV